MFNPTALVIESFVQELQTMYQRVYGLLEPGYPGIIGFIGRVALENIANSDAPYHDVNHTIMVTLVGQEILRGKHIVQGGITPRDWLHFMVSLLCHDIGYVRGVCHGDGDGRYVMNAKGETTELPPGATDAALTPYHVNRSKLFVRERFGKVALIMTTRLWAPMGWMARVGAEYEVSVKGNFSTSTSRRIALTALEASAA